MTIRTSGIRVRAACAAAVVSGVVFPGAALADAVTEWNEITDQALLNAGPPPVHDRFSAMVNIAVSDALNAIEPRYGSYTAVPSANSGASPGAAVAAAAYTALSALVPAQAAALEVVYDNRIAELGACPQAYPTCIEDGVAVGEAAALAILALRTGDGSDTPHLPYLLPPGPGVYQPTPPAFPAPVFAGWASVTPFVLNSGSQFRADPAEVLDLSSDVYARDYQEVKRIGAADAEATGDRTPEQSDIARYWPGGGINFNAVTRVIVVGRGLDLWEHARLFAILNAAIADASVATFDTKYTYNFWRPVTAIRAGDTDGNPATDADPEWTPFLVTPPYPDYTCGLPTAAGAGVEVLRRFFRTDAIPYTFTAAGVTRSYASLSEAGAESIDARVYAGIHFRTGCVGGLRQGEQLGRFAFQHHFRPVRKAK